MKRLTKIHGHDERIHIYFWVTDKGLCWEGRGLGRSDERSMADGHYRNPERDFTNHLDAWRLLGAQLTTTNAVGEGTVGTARTRRPGRAGPPPA
jgi:hypothetical protein